MPKIRLLPILAFIVVCVGVGSALLLLKVKDISLLSEKPCFSQDQFLKEINILDKPLILVSESDLTSQVKKKFSCIADLKVSKKFPSTLVLDYKGKVPVARIDGSENQLTVDGLVIKATTGTLIPVIFLPSEQNIQLNQQVSDPRILLSLQLADLLAKSDFAPSNIRFVNQTITIYNQQEAIAIFSTEKPALEQINGLQQVLAKAKIDSKKISKIDMRFNNPIIVFK